MHGKNIDAMTMQESKAPLHYVGIGASAGGLEAKQQIALADVVVLGETMVGHRSLPPVGPVALALHAQHVDGRAPSWQRTATTDRPRTQEATVLDPTDRVAMMRRGRILAVDTPASFLKSDNWFIRAFLDGRVPEEDQP